MKDGKAVFSVSNVRLASILTVKRGAGSVSLIERGRRVKAGRRSVLEPMLRRVIDKFGATWWISVS